MSSNPPERLSMLALGIRGDQPLDPEQPPLVDGVHLRWAPAQELGFPWHGFYLFRRETRPSRPRCLKKELIENPPRPGSGPRYETAIGTLSSSKPLVYTDDFPDEGVVEADLAAPLRFDLPPGVETGRVDLRVGFRETPRLVRTCVDFRTLPLGGGPTPRTEQGAVFTVQPVHVVTQPPDAAIEQWNGGPPGLEFTSPVTVTYRLDIALPCPATKVDLLLSNRDAIFVQAFEGAGATAEGGRSFGPRALQATPVTLRGKAIEHVTIESTSVDSALLHEICWECLGKGSGTVDGPEVKVDFTTHGLLEFPNPVVDQAVTFESQEEIGIRAPLAWFERAQKIGLHVRRRLEIRLPCATPRAEMFLTKRTDGDPATVTAFREDGSVDQQLTVAAFGEQTIAVAGDAITSIRIDAPFADVLLHTLSFRCRGNAKQTIRVRGLSYDTEVTQLDMTAEGGQVVVTFVTAEAITAIEIGPGKAALIDLCYTPTRQPVPFGWETVPGFQYPLCLPVAHPDYPCASKPADPDAARNLALSRVTYPAPPEREDGFAKLHEELVLLVRDGPAGGPMAQRVRARLQGQSESPVTQEAPSMPDLRPLDLVLLASLHPAYAQMLGLYFVDRDVAPGAAYDYLLLADPVGVLGGSAETALAWLAGAPDAQVYAELLLDRRAEPRAPIAPPAGARAYALPAPAARQIDGSVPDAAGNVGLWWPLPPDTEEEEPDRIIFYDVRRASFGPTRPASAPDASQYQRIERLRAVLISEPDPPPPVVADARSSDWPPPAIPMHAVDGNLAEGWYSFRIAGQDLFGRRSVPGPPAEWYQWDPPAGTAPPWYWKSPGGLRPIDPYAVALLDKVPPPAPLGVEAWALDPEDRWLLKDAAYDTWRSGVSSTLIGLRVRWRWTLLQQLQAPDTREFRVYWQPGRWNAIPGNLETVSAAAADQSHALLDFADAHGADAFRNARLRVGNDDFAILGSDSVGGKLRLRVQNIGAQDEVRPKEGSGCTVAIPAGHPLFVDTSRPPSWARRVAVVPYDPPLATVIDASKDANGRPLTREEFNAPVAVSGDVVQLPAAADLSGIQPWIDHLWLKDAADVQETIRILRFDTALRTVTLEAAPAVVPQEWKIGRPAREYEIFLPAPDVAPPNARFEPTLADPVVYAQVAVSAADRRVHVVDTWPGSPLGNLPGNESPLSPSATVYRVLQAPPVPPELPESADRLWATPADWRDRSYSTFRFVQKEHLRVHVLRALDDTLFQRDWLIRETRIELDAAAHDESFPDGVDRAAVVAELKTFTSYATLSEDARKVLAWLPGNEGAASLADRDALIRRTRKTLSGADTEYFPKTWTPATRNAVAAELNAIAKPADYETLSYGALRVLAGLPGNEAAFTQVTLEPLAMNAPSLLDERRPDDAAQYTSPDANIRAYTDTLPGRATNRYFYRAAFVDPAQNISALSLAGPPVYLPKVEPPRAPVITGVVSGERAVTLKWAPNHEPDLAEYRVYRSFDAEAARDIRRMTRVGTVAASDVAPMQPAVEWPEKSRLTGGQKLFYRVTAVAVAGHESMPSSVATTVVVDTAIPTAPTWSDARWLLQRRSDEALLDWPADGVVPAGHKPVLRLEWRSATPQAHFDLARLRRGERAWVDLGGTIVSDASQQDRFTYLDTSADPTVESSYRLRVRSSSGVWSQEDAVFAAELPEVAS